MSVYKLILDNALRKISWFYNDSIVEVKEFHNFSMVRDDTQRKLICGILRDKGSISRLIYYTYCGDKIFDVVFPDGEIAINNKCNIIKKKFPNLKIADYYPKSNLILIGVGEKEYSEKMIGISGKGEIVFEKYPPKQSKFWYFGIFNGIPSVACIGGENAEGVYCRSGYWYEVQSDTGDLIKKDVAY